MSTGYIVLLVLLVAIAICAALLWDKIKGLFGGVSAYVEEVRFEMGKVTWPSMEEVINSTVLVLIVTAAMTVMVFCVDSIFAQIFGLLVMGGGK